MSEAIPTNFIGRAKRIDDIDLPRIGALIGVGEDEIHAVIDVESRGSGFDRLNRPLILFEPHIFWRELGAGAKRDYAVKQGLAYKDWGEKGYPADSYPRLLAAMQIDRRAALRSASWGLGQIMGFNHAAAGYDGVEAMVAAFCADEDAHLAAMINFIKSRKLDDELRRHDWTGFAVGYNGVGYRRNQYDTRLSRSFAKWKGIRDTKWNPNDAMTETAKFDAPSGHVTAPPVVVQPKPAPVDPVKTTSTKPTKPTTPAPPSAWRRFIDAIFAGTAR